MKALTLWRPWSWSIVHGPKRLENRPWAPWPDIIGQRIAIHAGKKWDDEGAYYIGLHWKPEGVLPSGYRDEGIVGTAVVSRFIIGNELTRTGVPEGQQCWMFGPFAWVLEDVMALERPIPCKGALGLWEVPKSISDLVPELR